MEFENLKAAARSITMPEATKGRIVKNCNTMRKETYMNHNQKTMIRRPAAVLAVMVLCLSLSVTVLAATGTLDGFFMDLKNFGGAIVGTAYENATDEITFDASVEGNELIVFAGFADPEAFPYRETEQLGIAEYQILNGKNEVVQEGSVEAAQVVDGSAVLKIGIDDLESGSYLLKVSAFVSEKKADQPLNLYGNWEFAVTK